MHRIPPIERDELSGEPLAVFDRELARFGRLTNMKRTLMHSLPSYRALMEWYPLYETIKGFLGERLAIIFAHTISSESDCLICTTYMRRILIGWGEKPDPVSGELKLNLDDKGRALVAFGRAVVKPGNRVAPELYRELERFFNAEQIVALTAFASVMVATNIVNNALEVELDEYLYEYAKKGEGKRGA